MPTPIPVVEHVTVVFGSPSRLALRGGGRDDARLCVWVAGRWRHLRAARPDDLSAGFGAILGIHGRYGLLRSRLASQRGSAEVAHSTELRSVETSPQCALGVAQGARTTPFFERGLHPTVEPGHCRWRHRRLDPLV